MIYSGECAGGGARKSARRATLLWRTEAAEMEVWNLALCKAAGLTMNDRIIRGRMTSWQWDCREDSNVWELFGLLFSSIGSAIQRQILKPLAGHFLDFKLSCSGFAESGSTYNGLAVVICLVFGDS